MARPLLGRLRAALRGMKRGWTLYSDEAIAAFGGQAGGRLLMDWATINVHPDDEIRGNASRLRSRARDLQKYNPYIKQFLTLLSANVIGPDGFKMNGRVMGSRKKPLVTVNDKLESAWSAYWDKPVTVDGRLDGIALQHLLIKSMARDGEVFVRLWRNFPDNEFGLALEPIDPELVDEMFNRPAKDGVGEVRMGVEVNRFAAAQAFHVWNRMDKSLPESKRTREVIPADQIIHLFVPERVGQIRAATWLTPIMVSTKMLSGYTEAELVAARVAAAKMGFFTNKDGLGGTPDLSGSPGTDAKSPMTMSGDPGTIGIAPPFMSFEGWDPTHPTSAFPDFVKSILREIATGLGVSYNALANDLEGVNYSSMRSGLLVERDIWRLLQKWWSRIFLQRVFEEWLNMALLRGAVDLGSRDYRKYRDVTWTARGWAWVDPLKDVQAAILGINNGLGSRTIALAEQGEDYETILNDLAQEQDLAAEKGVEIKAPAPAIQGQPGDPSLQDTGTPPAKPKKATGQAAVTNGHAHTEA